MGDENQLVQRLANNVWFRQTDYVRDERRNFVRRNALSTEEDLKAMALRTKPHTNLWLYLSPRLCALEQDASDHAPAVVREIHQYLRRILDVREQAEATMLGFMQEMNTMSSDQLQADVLAIRAEHERSHAILAGMRVGWSPAFISSCYPRASRNLIANFVRDIRKLSIGLVLALYVTFGHESFVKRPLVLFTQELADFRVVGLLTLIAMTYGRLGDLFVLLSYPEQLQGPKREFDAQKDWRTLLLQYLLQQNRSLTREDKRISSMSEVKRCGGMPLLTDLALMMRIDPLAMIFGLREFVTVVMDLQWCTCSLKDEWRRTGIQFCM